MNFPVLPRFLRAALGALAFGLALLCPAGSPAIADQAYDNPTMNGATVDNCAVWANDCGWGGAHQFCRMQGFAGARSFQLNRPGRTYVVGSKQFCDGGNCVGFSQVVCMNAATIGSGDRAFDAPQMGGAAVDNCAVWANDCGWGGAHQFCRTQGYAAATSFSLYNPGRTYVIGSKQFCDGGSCVGFSQVICTGGTAPPPPPPPPPPTSGGPLAGRWAWAGGYTNYYYFQQNGNTFSWSQPSGNETAQGTVNGDGSLTVRWTNPGGTDSATGTVLERDAGGRATLILWSNGVKFARTD